MMKCIFKRVIFLTILVLVFCNIDPSFACLCTDPPFTIVRGNWPVTVDRGVTAEFTAITDPSGLESYITWSAPGSTNPTGTGGTFQTTWLVGGYYSVTVSNCYSSYSANVYVPAGVDIDTDSNNNGIINISDDLIEENSPGKIVTDNTDDDNRNGIPDKNETGIVNNEDDLTQVNLSYSPLSGINGRKVTLLQSVGGSNIKLWTTPNKETQIILPKTYIVGTNTIPTVLYAEGVNTGEVVIDAIMQLANETEVVRDKVKFTVHDTYKPFVTIAHAISQSDPSTIDFAVTFSEPVDGFDGNDVIISGTAGATLASVTDSGDHITYNAAISGMSQDGIVTVMIDAGAAQDAIGNTNTASNTVSIYYSPMFVPTDVICVNDNSGDDSNDGFAWGRAKKTVHAALEDVKNSATRKEIWVAAGTYDVLSTWPYGFDIPSGVKLYGGFSGGETWRDQREWREHETILDGNEVYDFVLSTDDITSTSVLDGFTIRNGGGAGINLYNSTLTISNNKISMNADSGICCSYGSSPIISGNLIKDNPIGITSIQSDSAIYNNIITLSSDTAISCSNTDTSFILNNTVIGNGHGILLDGALSTISNNIVAFQTATGISAQNDAIPTLSHNCVYGNGMNYSGTSADFNSISPDINVPMFANKEAGDYHLVIESPCIDAGSDSEVQGNEDFDGWIRLVDIANRGNNLTDIVDMGACEFNVPYVANVTSTIPDGTYGPGDLISIQVEFSASVFVDGNPQLELQTGTPGAKADYYAHYGRTVEFTYEVQSGDTIADLDYLSKNALQLNSSFITDANGLDIIPILPLPASAGSLGFNKNIIISSSPSVTIEQAGNQADPTGDQVIHFTATFLQSVGDYFPYGDRVALSGTAGAKKAIITQTDTSGKIFDIAVSGMTQTGTVVATIPAFDDRNGHYYNASTSIDNTVDFNEAILPTTIIIVDGDNGNDSNDGSTWLLAKRTVEAALDVATSSPVLKEIWVAEGIYDAPASGSFELGLDVKLYGGFARTEKQRYQRNWHDNVTILQGSGIDQDQNVVTIDQTSTSQPAIVDGFIIQDGACGVLCNADGLIEHNIIKHNKTGISCPSQVGGLPVIRNNVITQFVDNGVDLGVTNGLVTNNTIVSAIMVAGLTGDGNGVYGNSETAILCNNIITGCTTGVSTDGEEAPQVYNNDLFENSNDYVGFEDQGLDIHTDPLFIDEVNGNYRLFVESPCVDAGANDLDSDIDLDGAPRNMDIPWVGNSGKDVCDLGAYEFDGVCVTNVTSTTPDGIYATDQNIYIHVSFSEPVFVDAGAEVPSIQLDIESTTRQATYVDGSGSDTLIFDYVVKSGDVSPDLDYANKTAFALNGGHITDALDADAVLILPEPGTIGSLGANNNIVVDATAPYVVAVTSTNQDNHTYVTDDNINIQVMFNEPVQVTGSLSLNLALGSTEPRLAYCESSEVATDTITFSYTVQDGDNSLDLDYVDAQALSGECTVKDVVGNDATIILPEPHSMHSLSANKDIVVYACASSPTTFYVSMYGIDDGNGSSWENAFATVQYAFIKINTLPISTPVELLVSEGYYSDICLELRPGVSLRGGYWLDGETSNWERDPVNHETRLIGSGESSVIWVLPDAQPNNTLIDGFTIMGGSSTTGGGILCDNASPTISHNVIKWNYADTGGGIGSWQGSPLIANNIIEENVAYSGGGIYSYNGSPSISNNIINGNIAVEGGGIECAWGGYPIVTNNTIVANQAGVQGGGILNSKSSTVIANNIVVYNSSGIKEAYYDPGYITTITHNCVYSNPVWDRNDAGNQDYSGILPDAIVHPVDVDPQFLDISHHLKYNSPCVDVGNNDCSNQNDTDIDGQPRIVSMHFGINLVDIGADEFLDVIPPTGTIEIVAENDFTDTADVQLQLTASDSESGVVEMRFRNDEDEWSTWEAYATSKSSWMLADEDGLKTVSVQYKDYVGNVSEIVSDTVVLELSAEETEGNSDDESVLITGFTLSTDPDSSTIWQKQDINVLFSTPDADIDHFEVSTDNENFTRTDVVWPGKWFDDQLDGANKGASSSLSYTAGFWGSAGHFSSVENFVHYSSLKFPNKGTISFFVKADYDITHNTNTILDTCGTTLSSGDMKITVKSDNKLHLAMRDNSGWYSVDSTTSISNTASPTWTYIAVSYGSAGLKLYVDGVHQGTVSECNIYRAAHGVFLGDSQNDGTNNHNAFKGYIDCIRTSNAQSDINLTDVPAEYKMSWKMTQEGKKTVYVKAVDINSDTMIQSTLTRIDRTLPTFSITASPAVAIKNKDTVTIMCATECLGAVPTIKVNGKAASYSSSIRSSSSNTATYTYKYIVSNTDNVGAAAISISGTDRAGNIGTVTNTTALQIKGLTWPAGNLAVDKSGTVMLGWSYNDTFDKFDVEYSANNGTTWLKYNLFPIKATTSDYRLWSMGVGQRKFRVRVYRTSDNVEFVAGTTNNIPVPGIATLTPLPYVDFLTVDPQNNSRGKSYVAKY